MNLARVCGLFKDRCATLVELADWAAMYMADVEPGPQDRDAHAGAAIAPALQSLRDALAALPVWDRGGIAAAFKQTLAAHGLKMPQLANAVRVLVCGRVQTPSIDAVLELFPRARVLARLQAA